MDSLFHNLNHQDFVRTEIGTLNCEQSRTIIDQRKRIIKHYWIL